MNPDGVDHFAAVSNKGNPEKEQKDTAGLNNQFIYSSGEKPFSGANQDANRAEPEEIGQDMTEIKCNNACGAGLCGNEHQGKTCG